jgi:hypothetical protein
MSLSKLAAVELQLVMQLLQRTELMQGQMLPLHSRLRIVAVCMATRRAALCHSARR